MANDMGVLRQDASGGAVHFERRYPVPAAELWRYLTDPEHLSVWVTSGAVFDKHVGGRVYFPWDEEPAMEGVVTRYEPPVVIEYRWIERGNDSLVRFELVAEGDQTLLIVDHSGLLIDSAGFAVGWHSHLDWLAHIVSGSPAEFNEKARFQELAPQYGWVGPAHAQV